MNNGLKEALQGLAMELGVESPVEEAQVGKPQGEAQARAPSGEFPRGSALASHEFAISVAGGRIHVQNTAGKTIEVGDLVDEHGVYAYRLDAGGIQGQQFGSQESALRHLAAQLTFLYLDQLFIQLPDSAAKAGAHPMSGPALRIEVAEGTDELRGKQDLGD